MMKRICLIGWVMMIASGLVLFWGWGLAQASQVTAAPVSPAFLTEDSQCAFQAITVTAAHLGVTPGISDTRVGSAENRFVYIANHEPGVLTVTAAVSASQSTPCHLWGSAAFDQPAAQFISGAGHTYWLTYTLPASQGLTPLLPTPLVMTSSWSITGTMLLTLSHQARLTLTQDIAPPQITLTVPSQISATAFTVAWAVQDAESGVASYTVAYSGTGYTDWKIWITDTEQVSATFPVPTFPGTYCFRVTACDYVGNCGYKDKTTQVAPIHVYLPLTLRNWVWWYMYDIYEPNNTPQQAYGPLQFGTWHTAYIWDSTDTNDYYFINGTGSSVRVDLETPEDSDLDLYIYILEGGQYVLKGYSNKYGRGVDETVTLATSQGTRYYIRVYPYLFGFGEHLPYRLKVSNIVK